MVAFNKRASSKDGLTYQCKACTKKDSAKIGDDGLTSSQRRQSKLGEDGLTYNQRFAAKVDEDGLRYHQRWGRKNPEKLRTNRLVKYGLTLSDFESILNKQGGACAICGSTGKKWCVDHDHVTGTVRAILCNNCNAGIGYLGDSSTIAAAASSYLTKHGK